MNKKKELLEKMNELDKAYGENPIFSDELDHLKNEFEKMESSIAVVGQFSVGKSSLLNALLGEELLSSRTVETTKVLTRIRNCKDKKQAKLILTYKSGLTEERKIEDINELNLLTTFQGEEISDELEFVDLFWPIQFLNNELVLIDTPGANSTTTSAFDTTRKQLKSSASILYLFLATKGLDKIDYEILNEYSNKGKKIFLVGNHRDKISDNEWEEVKFDVEDKLKKHTNLKDVVVLSVSSTKALEAKLYNDKEKLEKSHLIELESALYSYMSKEEYWEAELRSFEYDLLMLEREIAIYENELIEEEISNKKDQEIRLNRLKALTHKEFSETRNIGLKILENRNVDVKSINEKYSELIKIDGENTFNQAREYINKNIGNNKYGNPSDSEIIDYHSSLNSFMNNIYKDLYHKIEETMKKYINEINMNMYEQDNEFIEILMQIDTNTPIDWQIFSSIISQLSIKEVTFKFEDTEYNEKIQELSLIDAYILQCKGILEKIDGEREKLANVLSNKLIELKNEESNKIRRLGYKPNPVPIYKEKGFLMFNSRKFSHYDDSNVQEWNNNRIKIHKYYKYKIQEAQNVYDNNLEKSRKKEDEVKDEIDNLEEEKNVLLDSLVNHYYEMKLNHTRKHKETHSKIMKMINKEWNNVVNMQKEECKNHIEMIEIKFSEFIDKSEETAIANIKIN
ncbi:dynamin family protein [Macrococcus capreoli]